MIPDTPQPSFGLSGKHILLVEDEVPVALALEDGLRAAGAVVVGPVGSVAEALALIEAPEGGRLAAAVVDVNLGGEIATAVGAALVRRGIPCLLETGYPDGRRMGLAGAPVLQKPFPLLALVHAVADLLAEKAAANVM